MICDDVKSFAHEKSQPTIFIFNSTCRLVTGLLGTLVGIHLLDVLALRHGPLVAPEPPLGKLVDPLVRTGPAGLDHIKDATLVGGEPDNLADELADVVHALVLGSLARPVDLGDLGDGMSLVLSLCESSNHILSKGSLRRGVGGEEG